MTSTTPEELGTVLSVWAHPDDETYLAGGLMAAAVDNRQRVVCVSATAGERGTDDPVGWPPERLGATRRAEAAAAMAVLGVREHVWLDYPDGALAELDPRPAVDRLGALIDDLRPDTVLTFGPDGVTFHPDHIAVSRWTTEACDRAGRLGALRYAAVEEARYPTWAGLLEKLGGFMGEQRPPAVAPGDLEVHLVLGETLLDRKLRALAAMPSQTAAFLDAVGRDVYRTVIGTESFVAARPR